MEGKPNDRLILALLIAAFAATMVWGYVSGDFATLFRQRSPEERADTEQRALDHLFGSDQAFDPSADNVTTQVQGSGDTITWKMLAQAKLNADSQGKPTVEFSPKLLALDKHEITLTGYIFPLEASSEQSHFLLSAYPPSCPYCLPDGPTELVEVTESKPMRFTYDPITIRGSLHLLRDEVTQNGLFYQITQVQLMK